MEENSYNKTAKERKNIVYVFLIILFVIFLAAVIVIFKLKTFEQEYCFTRECINSSVFFLDLIDSKHDPCDNFYSFVCGNYKGVSLINSSQNEINENLRHLIVDPIEDTDSRSVKLQKRYYQACTNLSVIEKDENKSLKKLFQKIGGWPVLEGDTWNQTDFNWGTIVERCKENGLDYDWFMYIHNSNEDVFDSKLYITPPDSSNVFEKWIKEINLKLITNVVKILNDTKYNNTQANSRELTDIVDFENKLHKIIQESLNSTSSEYTKEQLENKFPRIPWDSILKYIIPTNNLTIVLSETDYISKLEVLLSETPKRVQANYIFWKLTESFSMFLTHDIRREFDTYDAVLSQHYIMETDREKYCYGITSTVFAYVSEAEFARKYVKEKNLVEKMVDNIKSVLHDQIKKSKWIYDSDKGDIVAKLNNVTVVVGAPEEMYHEHEFGEFLGVDQIDIFNLTNTIEIISAVDKKRDFYNMNFNKPKLSEQQATLYQGVTNLGLLGYQIQENTIFLPAAVLNSFFFVKGRPDFLNYGAIGTIIGHELAHVVMHPGFENDDSVAWSNYTLDNFFNVAICLLENCNDTTRENNFNMSCLSTFEENFADHVGIQLSYEAYKNQEKTKGKERPLPGLSYNSRQLFWTMFASTMCNNNDMINNMEVISHLLPFQRILSTFRNSKYFAEDFNCPVKTNMNSEIKCNIL